MRRQQENSDVTNRSMPPGIFIPELAYPDVVVAAEWLCRTFGFSERLRIGIHRIQLTYRDAAVVAIDGVPPDPPSRDHGVMVSVEDVDGHHARAAANGAEILSPPTTYPFGERQYSARDVGGHHWTFSQSVADVDPRDWGGVLV